MKQIIFSGHVIRRIFERGFKKEEVLQVAEKGEVIVEYPEDKPFPSRLMLGFVEGEPLHVVVAEDHNRETGYIVTAYTPDPGLWHNDFKTRRKP